MVKKKYLGYMNIWTDRRAVYYHNWVFKEICKIKGVAFDKSYIVDKKSAFNSAIKDQYYNEFLMEDITVKTEFVRTREEAKKIILKVSAVKGIQAFRPLIGKKLNLNKKKYKTPPNQ